MTASLQTDSRFRLEPSSARNLASQFGTPLYVIDERHFRNRIQAYIKAFKDASANDFPTELTFASKANSTLAVLAIASAEGCLIDVASEGELRAALAAGVPAARCHLHGNFKSPSELAFAFSVGISQIVVDNFPEIEQIAEHAQAQRCPQLVLRLAPGVDPVTHAKISTGQADTKFGFNITDGSAERALVRCRELQLPVIGFHCHVGSQLLDPKAQISGGQILAEFAARMKKVHGFVTEVLNVGGGLGIRYTEEDAPMDVQEYCDHLVSQLRSPLLDAGLRPKLVQEPGRSLIGESGVTLYRVGPIKIVPKRDGGERTYISVDGGLSDNPRPALYGSPYPIEAIPGDEREYADGLQVVTISGKHCETDRLFPDVSVADNVQTGDLIQVLCTGAYNSSMASQYNRFPRPKTVLIATSGEPVLVQREDRWDEMFSREIVPDSVRV